MKLSPQPRSSACPVHAQDRRQTGSRGITKITDLSRMREAYDYALAATDADHMVVERFVDGREVGIDALVQNGRLLLMLPHEKYVYHSGHTGIPHRPLLPDGGFPAPA